MILKGSGWMVRQLKLQTLWIKSKKREFLIDKEKRVLLSDSLFLLEILHFF